jgi:hypothetical protein
MENLFPLLLASLFVYLLFFRKGGMGMGCCGGHGGHSIHGGQSSQGSHDGHKHEFDNDRHFNELPEDGNKGVIDLREDQYTVLTVEEDRDSKELDRTI